MGDPEYFDLKTLFQLHDMDSDGYWNEYEFETIFLLDLNKVYPEDDPNTDPVERDEEMERMRRMVGNLDTDEDTRLSLDELLKLQEDGSLDANDEYEPLVDKNLYTEE